MNIKSVGLDFETSTIDHRELFAFSNDNAVIAMKKICEDYNANGAVIISTCNRTELYISGLEHKVKAGEILCEIKGVSYGKYHYLFNERNGDKAVDHIMEMACGIKSQIWGEDQILSQVKHAINLSRENNCSDAILEQLFQTAITAAKKVKSTVRLTHADNSVATAVIRQLQDSIGNIDGLQVMIIGNGEMGKLMAETLVHYGADVTMTIRQYHRGEVTIPCGCAAIPYDQRVDFAKKAKVIISATTSPHYTIKYDDAVAIIGESTKYFIDLAIPRDFDPEISALPNVEIYDIDSLGGVGGKVDKEALEKAYDILKRYKSSLLEWKDFRKMVPLINEIKEMIASDVVYQMKEINDVAKASEIAVEKVLIALKDNLDNSLWEDCYEAIMKSSVRR